LRIGIGNTLPHDAMFYVQSAFNPINVTALECPAFADAQTQTHTGSASHEFFCDCCVEVTF
jgi:hypothetical protein